jgi:hypothetical protein
VPAAATSETATTAFAAEAPETATGTTVYACHGVVIHGDTLTSHRHTKTIPHAHYTTSHSNNKKTTDPHINQ